MIYRVAQTTEYVWMITSLSWVNLQRVKVHILQMLKK